jgi:hypothetical protein
MPSQVTESQAGQQAAIPLQELQGDEQPNQEILRSDLAKVDGGKEAWVFLLASFTFEFVSLSCFPDWSWKHRT